ncbi:MAG TPA: Crp/Fnr family transcriptional regulator [Solirubrobacteraceae bacterium]
MTQKATFLAALPDNDRADLLATGQPRSWGRGEVLVRLGDPADTALVLTDGLVKIHRSNAEGAEVVLGIRGSGDLLGEVGANRDAFRTAHATALDPVEGVVIRIAALRNFLATHPAVTLALLDLALARLQAADTSRLEFVTAGSLARVAGRLVELAERFGVSRPEGGVDVRLPVNQEELASWSGASRESTARALRTLRELGLIETRRLRMVVLDLEGLRAHQPQL